KPNPNRAKCLLEKPKPINIRELQCWLGIANGYRTFINGYSQIVKPITSPDKTAVELFHFLTDLIKQFPQSPSWGPIDYVVVPKKTNLEQNDYVGFLAFENRFVHFDVSNELRKIQQIEFGGCGMMVELNCHGTESYQQAINRKKFNRIINLFGKTKRYFKTDSKEKHSEKTEPYAGKTSNTSNVSTNPFLTGVSHIELTETSKRTAGQSQKGSEPKKVRRESTNDSSNDSFTNVPSIIDKEQSLKSKCEEELKNLQVENKNLKNRIQELEQTIISLQLQKINESTKTQKVIDKLLKDREEANKASTTLLALTVAFNQ
ncbi:unnamed protein product, partial [Brachionus calyciflorus]